MPTAKHFVVDSDTDRMPFPHFRRPSVASEGCKGLRNGFVETLRRHFENVLVPVCVFAGNGAAFQRHHFLFACCSLYRNSRIIKR
jgi:hypothetical protein